MLKQTVLCVAFVVLSLPLVHLGVERFRRPPTVDFESEEWHARDRLIERAKVFVTPLPEIAKLDLSRPPNDPHPIDPSQVVECRYVPKSPNATTPKFGCELPNGEVIKVKYGTTPERPGEVAATRLLAALGFGSDHVTMVPKLRCMGCPWRPFQVRRLAEMFFAGPLLDRVIDHDSPRDFEWVAVERKMAGRAIEVGPHEGWDWIELPRVDPAKGGATRAELDALRLTAIFLGHWDNKATNQRLICEEGPGDTDPRAPCNRPFLLLQDVGATFGPTKVNHDRWAAMRIWADVPQCFVSLEKMPYHGGNFTPVQISDAGRRLLADRLTQLSEAQLRALFQSARFPEAESGEVTGDVEMWVTTFRDKVRQIVDRPPCPSLPN